MADEKLKRLVYLIGENNIDILKESHILLAGCGGVGSFVAEGLARSGVGELTLIDFDKIDISNLNRQLMTNKNNIGQKKVYILKKHLEEISDCKIIANDLFIDKNFIFLKKYDYIIDCIDILSGKITLAKLAIESNMPIISSMGSARRMSSEYLKVSNLANTKNDPLARNYRQLCRKEKIDAKRIKVIYYDTPPIQSTIIIDENGHNNKEKYPLGSFITPVGIAGLKIVETVINDLISRRSNNG